MTITKPPKLPKLGPDTKFLSFDLETNGLHGNVFAVGAVVVDARGNVLDKFAARCPLEHDVDTWVKANVFPVIHDMPVTHTEQKELRHDFWKWYLQAEPKCDYVLVSNGYPVEYRFLLQCQEDDLENRYWQHPFPILDLTSILIATGHESLAKSQLISSIIREGKFARHHPVDDATIAALAAFRALSLAQ